MTTEDLNGVVARHQREFVTTVVESLDHVTPEEWNQLVDPNDPFMEWAFLNALHRSGAVGDATSWKPLYHLLRQDGRLVGAAPLYIRYDSFGEFIFDWQWADAYQRAGMAYYPKAVVAVPFTPVAGRRLLYHPEVDRRAVTAELAVTLLRTTRENGLSGLHVLFCEQVEHDLLVDLGLLSRLGHQYHWENRGYSNFDDYLADLRSKKRKQIKKERAQVQAMDLDIRTVVGDEITTEHVDALWSFYLDTHAKKWGDPYLNRDTFEHLVATQRDRIVAVLAYHGTRAIAGTFSMRKGNRLLGRYWGSLVQVPALHFECCLYRLIDFAIAEGVELFEAGAQGEHKFLRGFAARPVYSVHKLAHSGAQSAIADFLDAEREHSLAAIDRYNAVSPLKSLRAATRDASA